MNFYDNYYTVGTKVKSKAARQEYFTAIIEYYYTGVEPVFKHEAAEIAFAGVRISLDKSRRNAANRTRTKSEGKANENGTNEEGNDISSDEDIFLSSNLHSSIDQTEENMMFPLACLSAFNEVFGTAYSTLPSNATRTLARFSGIYTIDEVRAMLKHRKSVWEGTKWSAGLTPKKLFGSDDFESFMHQSKQDAKEAEQYAIYD